MDHKKEIFSSKEDKLDFIIALVVITIFSAFIYQFFFKSQEKKAIDPLTELEKAQMKSTERITKNGEFLYTNSDKYKTETIVAEDAYELTKDSAVIISDIIKENILVTETKSIVDHEVNKSLDTDNKTTITSEMTRDDVKGIIVKETETESDSIINNKVNKSIEEYNNTIISSKNTIDDVNKIIDTKSASETNVTYKSTETDNTKIVTDTKIIEKTDDTTHDCVIVVGAFREVKNKTAIINKLVTLGYKPTEGTLKGGLNYVGVPVACNNKQENLKLLRELNKAFGIQSWIKRF